MRRAPHSPPVPVLRFFLEASDHVRLHLRRGTGHAHQSTESGVARDELDGGNRQHRSAPMAPGATLPAWLPGELGPVLRGLQADGLPAGRGDQLLALARTLEAQALQRGAAFIDLVIHETRRRIAVASPSGVVSDVQTWAIIELRTGADPRDDARAYERAAFPDGVAMLAGMARLDAVVDAALRAAALRKSLASVERGAMPVLLPPGADAGAIFHELCGHPFEGDVVHRGASCFSGNRGATVASDFLSVADHPRLDSGGCGYRFDDEGAPARQVLLIDRGRVGEPMRDRLEAEACGAAPDGHGRRTSFRFGALPRVSHTEVLPHAGDFAGILGSTANGLWVGQATPRHVNPLTGEFSFWVDEGRLIRDGVLGATVGPTLLRGTILDALRGIDAVGGDQRTSFGVKGCSKLDQPGLPVSFGLPTVRFSSLWVEPAP